MAEPLVNPFLGKWTYRSFRNNPDINTAPDDLVFAMAPLEFTDAPMGQVAGTIGGASSGFEFTLEGWVTYGNPPTVRFQGKGMVRGNLWIYDYNGYYVTHWPNGVDQVEAIVGSLIRTVPHPSSSGGTSPAGVVASFYAVKQ